MILIFQYVLSLVSSYYDVLGWKDEGTHPEKRNRINILALACKSGHAGCMDEAGKLFNEWIEKRTYIPANIRTMVYKYVIIIHI